MGYVYILESAGKTKIGISKNDPSIRVKQLQTGSPYPIRLVRAYRRKDYKQLERRLHNRFSYLQTEGGTEWFSINPSIVVAYIEGSTFMGRVFGLIYCIIQAVIIVFILAMFAIGYLSHFGYI